MPVVMFFMWIAGILIGAGLTIDQFKRSEETVQFKQGKELVAQCEQNLPRTQHCVLTMTAVPESK